jgi:HlyD family secretion protein
VTSGRVTALGRLAPRGEVINVGAPPGDRLARLAAGEGQYVETGQTLAYLDSHAERVAETKRLANQLAEAQARLTADTAFAGAQIVEAQARVNQVQALPRLEIQSQEARLRSIEAELENSRRELGRLANLRAKELVAQQDLDRQELAAHRNDMDAAAARSLLDKLRQGYDLDLRVAQAQLATAQAALYRAERSGEVGSLREALRSAEARLERSVIRAPVSGRILKIVSRAGEETGLRSILQMGDVSQMYAVAEVYETDLPRVRVGHRATVASPALERQLGGVVEVVGVAISRNLIVDVDPAASTDRRVAEVKIRLDDSRSAARLVNMQVTVAIDVERH